MTREMAELVAGTIRGFGYCIILCFSVGFVSLIVEGIHNSYTYWRDVIKVERKTDNKRRKQRPQISCRDI